MRSVLSDQRVRSRTAATATAEGLAMWALALIVTSLLSVEAANARDNEAGIEPVGAVSLVLGRAWVESADGDREAARVGTDIHATDRVITSGTGHVHIRFIDDALVSVRPHSRLRITDYVYDAEAPAESLVRFNLEEGVTRSISGEAGRNARERFRLDTPVAAIGVRGTDFVVSANSNNMRALVNEGAIVVASYSDSCVAGGLGPCVGGGVELAGTSMQVVELTEGQVQPMLRPLGQSRLYAMMDQSAVEGDEEARESADSEAENPNELPEGYRESVTIREVNGQARDDTATGGGAGGPGGAEAIAPAALEASVLAQRQLVWGRFFGPDIDTDIALAWPDAREGRSVTVGNGEFGLYRADNGLEGIDPALIGDTGFQLEAAQAVHEDGSGIESAVTVSGGDLRINFSRSTFATGLDLESDSTGSIRLDSSGELLPNGIFRQREGDGTVAGAVSADGSEAGYFFDQRIDNGVVRGTTLWGVGQ